MEKVQNKMKILYHLKENIQMRKDRMEKELLEMIYLNMK